MSSDSPASHPASEIAAIVRTTRAGHGGARAAMEASLARIAAIDGDVCAFREVGAETALARADAIDARVARGEDPGPLAGVPVAIKDNIVTTDTMTCAGSRILDGYRSPFNATVIDKLTAAGAIPFGKTNCDEFAMGSSTEHCHYGQTKNPWDLSRVPGGSSGGSAAAVAAGMCPVSLGSDTGGSIRQPAAFCGTVGVKPSYGRVSRWGLIAFGSSLDQIGPFARSVGDAAAVMQAICGIDRHDSTSVDRHLPDLTERMSQKISGLKVGLAREYQNDRNHPAVTAAFEHAVSIYRDAGAEIVDIDLPLTTHGIATYYVLATAEASSNLARYDGIRYGHRAELAAGEDLADLYMKSRAEGFGPEVKRRIMLGTYVLSAGYYDAYYKRALSVRRLIAAEYARAFESCHVILGPTTPAPAFHSGSIADPLTMYLCDVYTANTNIAGICGMSLPVSMAEDDGATLPVGVQLQAKAFDEETLFRAARQLESALRDSAAPVAPVPSGSANTDGAPA